MRLGASLVLISSVIFYASPVAAGIDYSAKEDYTATTKLESEVGYSKCGGTVTVEGEGVGKFKLDLCPDGSTLTSGPCYCKLPNGEVKDAGIALSYTKCAANCSSSYSGTIAESTGIGTRKPEPGKGCLKGPICGGCWEKTGGYDEPVGSWAEFCADTRIIPYAKCFCTDSAKTKIEPYDQEHAYNREQCEDKCKSKGLLMDSSQGAGKFGPTPQAPAGAGVTTDGKLALSKSENPLCFTPADCASADYGKAPDAFVQNTEKCGEGRGFCLAPEPDLDLSTPILGVSSIKGLRSYIDLIFRFILSIVVITTAVMFVYAGFKYIFGATAGNIASAKDTLLNALIGLVLTLGAVALLKTLNPDTLKFDRLKIYLISKQQLVTLNLCSEYGKAGSKIKFAAAGTPPGTKSYTDTKAYTVAAETTDCGQQYYPQGFRPGGATCYGDLCPQGASCLLCVPSGFGQVASAQCAGKKDTDRTCQKVAFGGSIGWTHYTEPLYLELMPVCASLQRGSKGIDLNTVVHDSLPLDGRVSVKANSKDILQGKLSYAFQVTASDIDSAVKACQGQGGLRGYMLGVVYKDTCSLNEVLLQGWLKEPSTRPGYFRTGLNLAECKISNNDALVITKRDCGSSGKKYYSGYANGGRHTEGGGNASLVRYAAYCGSIATPTEAAEPMGKKTFDKLGELVWTEKEMRDAAEGKTSLGCNFTLNDVNAPRNPGQYLMDGCSYKFFKFKDDGIAKDTFVGVND